MSTAAKIISDMGARLKLVDTQVQAGMSKEVLMQDAAGAFISMISMQNGLDIETQTEVTAAVVQAPWSNAQKERIASVLAAGHAGGENRTEHRKNQSCPNIEDFLTEEVWASIQDKNVSLYAKIGKLALFVQYGLNISCPGIPLLQRLASILVQTDTGNQLQTPESRKQAARKLQEAIKAGDKLKKPPGLPHIIQFPSDPKNLPSAVRLHAYKDEPAVPTKIPSLQIGESFVPYKKTHKSLQEVQPVQHQQQQPGNNMQIVSAGQQLAPQMQSPQVANVIEVLKTMVQAGFVNFQQQPQAQQETGSLAGLQIFGPGSSSSGSGGQPAPAGQQPNLNKSWSVGSLSDGSIQSPATPAKLPQAGPTTPNSGHGEQQGRIDPWSLPLPKGAPIDGGEDDIANLEKKLLDTAAEEKKSRKEAKDAEIRKRPAAAAKASVMKKPSADGALVHAAAAAPLLKRPSVACDPGPPAKGDGKRKRPRPSPEDYAPEKLAKAISLHEVIAYGEDKEHKSKESFLSTAFHSARNKAVKYGVPDEYAKKFGAFSRALAKRNYDDYHSE